MEVYWNIVPVLYVLDILLVVDEFLAVERVQEHHARVWLDWWISDKELENAHQGYAVLELCVDLRCYLGPIIVI